MPDVERRDSTSPARLEERGDHPGLAARGWTDQRWRDFRRVDTRQPGRRNHRQARRFLRAVSLVLSAARYGRRLLMLVGLCGWVAVTREAAASKSPELVASQTTTLERPAPDPQAALGFEPCTNYRLANSEAITAYFRALARALPGRVRLVDI